MARAARRTSATLILVATISGLLTLPAAAQTPIDVYELSDYRLTPETFERFVDASGRIVPILQTDATFTYAPLFTKEVALSGDAIAGAAGLMARLANHPSLSAALTEATITPREYAKFAITVIAAHLAHGFMKSGVLRQVPPGAPTINVEFVKTHEMDVAAVLAQLGLRD
jgi:hypothetical protein